MDDDKMIDEPLLFSQRMLLEKAAIDCLDKMNIATSVNSVILALDRCGYLDRAKVRKACTHESK